MELKEIKKYLTDIEQVPIPKFASIEDEVINAILKILIENKITVIRAKKILDFCITATELSTID